MMDNQSSVSNLFSNFIFGKLHGEEKIDLKDIRKHVNILHMSRSEDSKNDSIPGNHMTKRRTALVVDGQDLLPFLYGNNLRYSICGGQYTAMMERLVALFCLLQSSNIQLAIILNGAQPRLAYSGSKGAQNGSGYNEICAEAEFNEWKRRQIEFKARIRESIMSLVEVQHKYKKVVLNLPSVTKDIASSSELSGISLHSNKILPTAFNTFIRHALNVMGCPAVLCSVFDHKREVMQFLWENGYHGLITSPSPLTTLMYKPNRLFIASTLRFFSFASGLPGFKGDELLHNRDDDTDPFSTKTFFNMPFNDPFRMNILGEVYCVLMLMSESRFCNVFEKLLTCISTTVAKEEKNNKQEDVAGEQESEVSSTTPQGLSENAKSDLILTDGQKQSELPQQDGQQEVKKLQQQTYDRHLKWEWSVLSKKTFISIINYVNERVEEVFKDHCLNTDDFEKDKLLKLIFIKFAKICYQNEENKSISTDEHQVIKRLRETFVSKCLTMCHYLEGGTRDGYGKKHKTVNSAAINGQQSIGNNRGGGGRESRKVSDRATSTTENDEEQQQPDDNVEEEKDSFNGKSVSESRLTATTDYEINNSKSDDLVGDLTKDLASLHMNESKSCSEGVKGVKTPYVQSDVLATARERHRQGKMSTFLYHLLSTGQVRLPVLIECQDVFVDDEAINSIRDSKKRKKLKKTFHLLANSGLDLIYNAPSSSSTSNNTSSSSTNCVTNSNSISANNKSSGSQFKPFKPLPAAIHRIYSPLRRQIYAIVFNLNHMKFEAVHHKDKENNTSVQSSSVSVVISSEGEGQETVASADGGAMAKGCKQPINNKRVLDEATCSEWIVVHEYLPYNNYKIPEAVHAKPLTWSVPTLQRLWFGTSHEDKEKRLRALCSVMQSDFVLPKEGMMNYFGALAVTSAGGVGGPTSGGQNQSGGPGSLIFNSHLVPPQILMLVLVIRYLVHISPSEFISSSHASSIPSRPDDASPKKETIRRQNAEQNTVNEVIPSSSSKKDDDDNVKINRREIGEQNTVKDDYANTVTSSTNSPNDIELSDSGDGSEEEEDDDDEESDSCDESSADGNAAQKEAIKESERLKDKDKKETNESSENAKSSGNINMKNRGSNSSSNTAPPASPPNFILTPGELNVILVQTFILLRGPGGDNTGVIRDILVNNSNNNSNGNTGGGGGGGKSSHECVTRRGIAIATLITQGLDMLIGLNDVCGSPLPPNMAHIWTYFDGKLFQYLFSRMSCQSNDFSTSSSSRQHHHNTRKLRNTNKLVLLCEGQMDLVYAVNKAKIAILHGASQDTIKRYMPDYESFSAALNEQKQRVDQHQQMAAMISMQMASYFSSQAATVANNHNQQDGGRHHHSQFPPYHQHPPRSHPQHMSQGGGGGGASPHGATAAHKYNVQPPPRFGAHGPLSSYESGRNHYNNGGGRVNSMRNTMVGGSGGGGGGTINKHHGDTNGPNDGDSQSIYRGQDARCESGEGGRNNNYYGGRGVSGSTSYEQQHNRHYNNNGGLNRMNNGYNGGGNNFPSHHHNHPPPPSSHMGGGGGGGQNRSYQRHLNGEGGGGGIINGGPSNSSSQHNMAKAYHQHQQQQNRPMQHPPPTSQGAGVSSNNEITLNGNHATSPRNHTSGTVSGPVVNIQRQFGANNNSSANRPPPFIQHSRIGSGGGPPPRGGLAAGAPPPSFETSPPHQDIGNNNDIVCNNERRNHVQSQQPGGDPPRNNNPTTTMKPYNVALNGCPPPTPPKNGGSYHANTDMNSNDNGQIVSSPNGFPSLQSVGGVNNGLKVGGGGGGGIVNDAFLGTFPSSSRGLQHEGGWNQTAANPPTVAFQRHQEFNNNGNNNNNLPY